MNFFSIEKQRLTFKKLSVSSISPGGDEFPRSTGDSVRINSRSTAGEAEDPLCEDEYDGGVSGPAMSTPDMSRVKEGDGGVDI